MQVSLVPPDQVPYVWQAVKALLEPAVAVTNGRYTTEDVFYGLMAQDMTLWIAFDDDKQIVGCEVTKIVDYPSRQVLCSLFTAGEQATGSARAGMREWREPMMALLIRYARDVGCTAIEGQGRPGWIKLMEPYGVRPIAMLFEKDL
jgi:hypothetical protein